MKTFLAVLGLLFLGLSFAETCRPKNLIDEEDSPFKSIPIYDQDGTNLCYALTSAQMANYYLLKHKNLNVVHPAWIALNYSKSQNSSGLDFGNTKLALEALTKEGNCEHNKVAQAISYWAFLANVTEAEMLSFVEQFGKQLQTVITIKEGLATLDEKRINLAFKKTIDAKKIPCPPGALWDRLFPELRVLGSTATKVMEHVMTPLCRKEERISVTLPKVEQHVGFGSDEEAADKLSDLISSSPYPVGVSYCGKVWSTPNFKGVILNKEGKRDALEKDCGYHDSVVVGQKKMGETCHFLVRNSWGSRWTLDNKQWTCLCRSKATGALIHDCREETHNNEDVLVEACWLPRDILSKNIGRITNFVSKP